MLVAATRMVCFRGWMLGNARFSHGNEGGVAGVGEMLVAATGMGCFRGWMLGNARFSHENGCFSWLEGQST